MAKRVKCKRCGEKMTYDGENYYCRSCWAICWVEEDGMYFTDENCEYLIDDDLTYESVGFDDPVDYTFDDLDDYDDD